MNDQERSRHRRMTKRFSTMSPDELETALLTLFVAQHCIDDGVDLRAVRDAVRDRIEELKQNPFASMTPKQAKDAMLVVGTVVGAEGLLSVRASRELKLIGVRTVEDLTQWTADDMVKAIRNLKRPDGWPEHMETPKKSPKNTQAGGVGAEGTWTQPPTGAHPAAAPGRPGQEGVAGTAECEE